MGTEAEKEAIILKLNMVKGTARNCLMVVGVFLSMMLITSKNLIDSMKRIWNIRGHVYTNQLADRRFVLEFTVEGDYNHVVKVGPWSYKEDAVLIKALEEGEDPEKVIFTSVPIWAQFKDVTFYLLSQELARDLGSKVGELLFIDNDARGDLNDKIMRARVLLPVDRAIRRWVPLKDEVADDIVVSSVFYERLPSYCFFCGIIGHKKERCNIKEEDRIVGYGPELGVPPTLREDPRRYELPEIIGEHNQYKQRSMPWSFPKGKDIQENKTATIQQQALITQVAKEVAKLTMQVNNQDQGKETNNVNNQSQTSSVDSYQLLIDGPAAKVNDEGEVNKTNNVEKEGEGMTRAPAMTSPEKGGKWKRLAKAQNKEKTLTTQDSVLGAPRPREEWIDDEEEGHQHLYKKPFQIPSLEVCLGVENLRKIREEEADAFIAGVCATADNVKQNVQVVMLGSIQDGPQREEVENRKGENKVDEEGAVEIQNGVYDGQEATGLGAAGKLSGASVCAWQGPC
jgi:hypothetical protein